jgi:hypothetical protein
MGGEQMLSLKYRYQDKKFSPYEPQVMEQFKAGLTDGTDYRLTFESWEEKRGESQSALFHKLRDKYADEAGLNKEEAKADLKIRHGVSLSWDGVFAKRPKWPGAFVELWGEIRFLKSTAAYTTSELTALIDGTVRDLSELGVSVEDIMGGTR